MTVESKPTSVVTWAEGPLNYPTTDPGGAKKVVGWDENEIPASEHHNWLLMEAYKWIRYMAGHTDQHYEEVYLALAQGFVYPHVFYLTVPHSYAIKYTVDNSGTPGGDSDNINRMLTDGNLVYVSKEVTGDVVSIFAIKPDAIVTTIWSYVAGDPILDWHVDGRYLYMAETAVAGIQVYNPNTGAYEFSIDPEAPENTNPIKVVGNGLYVASIDSSNVDQVNIFQIDENETVTDVGVVDLTSTNPTVTMEVWGWFGRTLYMVYQDTGTYEYTFAAARHDCGGTASYYRTLAATTLAPCGLLADQYRVYVGTTYGLILTGHTGAVHGFRANDGEWLWTTVLPANTDCISLSMNSRYLYAVGADHWVYVIDKETGVIVENQERGLAHKCLVDETSIYLENSADPTIMSRLWLCNVSSIPLQVGEPGDPWRVNQQRVWPIKP